MRQYNASFQEYKRIEDLIAQIGFRNKSGGQWFIVQKIKSYAPYKKITHYCAQNVIAFLESELKLRMSSLKRREANNFSIISATDLAEHVYCPQISILKKNGVGKHTTESAIDGSYKHKVEDVNMHLTNIRRKRTILNKFFNYLFPKFSNSYINFLKNELKDAECIYNSNDTVDSLKFKDIIGKPDYIFSSPSGNVLLECKWSRGDIKKLFRSHKIQLATYWFLCEKNNIKLKKMFLLKYSFNDRSFSPAIINAINEYGLNYEEMLKTVYGLRKDLLETIETNSLGKFFNFNIKKCCGCGYRYNCCHFLEARKYFN